MFSSSSPRPDAGTGRPGLAEQLNRDHLLAEIAKGLVTAHARLDEMEERVRTAAADSVRTSLKSQMVALKKTDSDLRLSTERLFLWVNSLGVVETQLREATVAGVVASIREPVASLKECSDALGARTLGLGEHLDRLQELECRLQEAAVLSAREQLSEPVASLEKEGASLAAHLGHLDRQLKSFAGVEERLLTQTEQASELLLRGSINSLETTRASLGESAAALDQRLQGLLGVEGRLRTAAVESVREQLSGPVSALHQYEILAREHVGELSRLHTELDRMRASLAETAQGLLQQQGDQLTRVINERSRETLNHTEQSRRALEQSLGAFRKEQDDANRQAREHLIRSHDSIIRQLDAYLAAKSGSTAMRLAVLEQQVQSLSAALTAADFRLADRLQALADRSADQHHSLTSQLWLAAGLLGGAFGFAYNFHVVGGIALLWWAPTPVLLLALQIQQVFRARKPHSPAPTR